jgi:hypothetical protein
MRKGILLTLGLLAALVLTTGKPCNAAFTIGGENGWQLTTDGIVDVFTYYDTTSKAPDASHVTATDLLDNGSTTAYNQRFGIGVGLLPSVVAFNIKAPTTNGIDSTVRIGIYPSLSNAAAGTGGNAGGNNRFNTGANIDFRELFYTAKGAYGELLAGKALNLYQGQNILTDMTLLTVGVVGGPTNSVTLGHIGSGYLYTGFGPQIRYTTPDMAGLKLAVEVGEPYNITAATAKTNSPRVESELSYAQVIGGTAIHAWLDGLYQTAVRSDAPGTPRPGANDESIGGAYGASVGFGGLNLLGSGYGGRGLGMASVQDGATFGDTDDAFGRTRLYWGFLLQATYKLTPSVTTGVNYGQTRQEKNDGEPAGPIIMKNQESGTFNVVYNLNKFTQFIAEYTYAQDTWYDSAKQHENAFALGTMFYW